MGEAGELAVKTSRSNGKSAPDSNEKTRRPTTFRGKIAAKSESEKEGKKEQKMFKLAENSGRKSFIRRNRTGISKCKSGKHQPGNKRKVTEGRKDKVYVRSIIHPREKA